MTADNDRPDPTAPWTVFFRDPDLTDADALGHIDRVATTMVETCLACRLSLLEAGFADNHPQCVDLDAIAESWTNVQTICRRTLAEKQKEQNDERTTE